MAKANNGLSEFVRRIMKLRGFTQKEVEKRSGGRITDGYVASIVTNRATNLSVEKLVALGDGLGVDPDELFHVSRGVPQDEHKKTHAANPLLILDIVRKAVTNSDLTEILDQSVRMLPENRRLLLKSMKKASASKSKPGQKGKKTNTQQR